MQGMETLLLSPPSLEKMQEKQTPLPFATYIAILGGSEPSSHPIPQTDVNQLLNKRQLQTCSAVVQLAQCNPNLSLIGSQADCVKQGKSDCRTDSLRNLWHRYLFLSVKKMENKKKASLV